MLGQVFSPENRKYNLIILAGGAGSRMGNASEFLPKALTKIGSGRAIDLIIRRYAPVTERLIVGTGFHADLLEAYVCGTYLGEVYFSREDVSEMRGDGLSALFCLDYADSRLGTVIVYCDLLPLGNFELRDNSILVANGNTKGIVGTFRNEVIMKGHIADIRALPKPAKVGEECSLGVLGTFVIGNTPLLKQIVYGSFDTLQDLTREVIRPYVKLERVSADPCDVVIEFGTEFDLQLARRFWEKVKR